MISHTEFRPKGPFFAQNLNLKKRIILVFL